MSGRDERHMRTYRPLLIILVITVAIWTAWAMSEPQTYSSSVRVEMVGVDTVCNAIVSKDTSVTIDITSNGYKAIGRYFAFHNQRLVLDMGQGKVCSDHASVSMNMVISELRKQFDIPYNTPISSTSDSLRVYYSPRLKKAMVPQLKNLSVNFVGGYGLSGHPYLIEDTVWLYGSQASLDKVNVLHTEKVRLDGMRLTDTIEVGLDPVWRKYPDLRVSKTHVSLVVPSQLYSEQVVSVPIKAVVSDTSLHVKLYPEHVKVHLLVPSGESGQWNDDMFKCQVHADLGSEKAHVYVSRFPANARIKKVEPETVQYVFIK